MTMRSTTRRALLAILPVAIGGLALAQTAAMPLDVKTGLWETTMTSTSSANGTAMPPQTRTTKSCMTPARLQKGLDAAASPQQMAGMDCKRDVTNQTATSMDMKMSCTMAQMPNQKMETTAHMEVLSRESMKSESTVSMTGAMQSTTHVQTTSKWVAADCGDIK
jgi:hypothetical protein